MSLVVSPLELGDSNGWVASALERMRLLSNVINMKINLPFLLGHCKKTSMPAEHHAVVWLVSYFFKVLSETVVMFDYFLNKPCCRSFYSHCLISRENLKSQRLLLL